jgi:hypothetical protein
MLSSSLIYYYFHRRRKQQDKAPTETAGQRPSETPIPQGSLPAPNERFRRVFPKSFDVPKTRRLAAVAPISNPVENWASRAEETPETRRAILRRQRI